MPKVWGGTGQKAKGSGWTDTAGKQSWSAFAPPPGRFHAWLAKSTEGGGSVADPLLVCLLGPTPPRLVRGLGGWDQVQRGGRRAASHWPGGETPAFEITLRLENVAVSSGQDGVRQKMRALERLCGGQFGGDEAPPRIQWAANAPLHDFTRAPSLEWVCEDFDYGDAVYADGARLLEVPATIVLAVAEGDELERLKRAVPFARKELRKGETLRRFAKRVLGDARRWSDVADLNADDRRIPKTPDAPARKSIRIAVPPREPKPRKSKRGS
jgi:hypothetical protein